MLEQQEYELIYLDKFLSIQEKLTLGVGRRMENK